MGHPIFHETFTVTTSGPPPPSPPTDLHHHHQLHRRRAVITTVTSTTVDGPSTPSTNTTAADGPSPLTDLQHRRRQWAVTTNGPPAPPSTGRHHQRTFNTVTNSTVDGPSPSTDLHHRRRQWAVITTVANSTVDGLSAPTGDRYGHHRRAIAITVVAIVPHPPHYPTSLLCWAHPSLIGHHQLAAPLPRSPLLLGQPLTYAPSSIGHPIVYETSFTGLPRIPPLPFLGQPLTYAPSSIGHPIVYKTSFTGLPHIPPPSPSFSPPLPPISRPAPYLCTIFHRPPHCLRDLFFTRLCPIYLRLLLPLGQPLTYAPSSIGHPMGSTRPPSLACPVYLRSHSRPAPYLCTIFHLPPHCLRDLFHWPARIPPLPFLGQPINSLGQLLWPLSPLPGTSIAQYNRTFVPHGPPVLPERLLFSLPVSYAFPSVSPSMPCRCRSLSSLITPGFQYLGQPITYHYISVFHIPYCYILSYLTLGRPIHYGQLHSWAHP